MTIFITGTAGFIGFHLAKGLLEKGCSVIGLDNINDYYSQSLKKARLKNLTELSLKLGVNFENKVGNLEDKNTVEQIFEDYNPKKVVNLAAQAGVRYSLVNPEAYIQSNIVGFSNVLECCRKYKTENLIFASSSSVYGLNSEIPFHEKQNVDHPISLYAATKKSNELMAHSYSHLYNIPSTGLRFFTVYGPWGRPDMALFLFTKSVLEGRPINVFNNGDMIRDFTYIDDIITSLILLLDKPAIKDNLFDCKNPNPSSSSAPFRIFNIGNSNPTPLLTYIEAIENVLNKKALKKFMDIQPGDVPITASNCNSLEDWLSFKPNTSISNGVEKFVTWYRDFYNV